MTWQRSEVDTPLIYLIQPGPAVENGDRPEKPCRGGSGAGLGSRSSRAAEVARTNRRRHVNGIEQANQLALGGNGKAAKRVGDHLIGDVAVEAEP